MGKPGQQIARGKPFKKTEGPINKKSGLIFSPYLIPKAKNEFHA